MATPTSAQHVWHDSWSRTGDMIGDQSTLSAMVFASFLSSQLSETYSFFEMSDVSSRAQRCH